MMYCNGSGPNKDDYADYFHYLLYLEEYEATQKMEQYNMRDVPVEIVAETRLKLKVSVSTLYMTVCDHTKKWNNAT
jgi:hypothetical protein